MLVLSCLISFAAFGTNVHAFQTPVDITDDPVIEDPCDCDAKYAADIAAIDARISAATLAVFNAWQDRLTSLAIQLGQGQITVAEHDDAVYQATLAYLAQLTGIAAVQAYEYAQAYLGMLGCKAA